MLEFQSLQEVELHQQWVVVLQDIPEAGIHWKGQIPCGIMQDSAIGETAPLEAMRSDLSWNGDLARRGDVYRLRGHWHFRAERCCSRCTEPFEMDVEGDADYDFRIGTELSEDDASNILLPPGKMNLVDVLREDIWLTWPQDPACRQNCRGLCSVCGCNRNEKKCLCHETDRNSPFEALGKLNLS